MMDQVNGMIRSINETDLIGKCLTHSFHNFHQTAHSFAQRTSDRQIFSFNFACGNQIRRRYGKC